MQDLKGKAISGIKWQVVNKTGQKIISVLTFAVLARLLDPSTFGLFAMAFLAIDGMGMFKTLGLDAGFIQRRDCPESAQHTVYWMIQGAGFLLFLACIIVAPIAAHFFHTRQVQWIIMTLGLFFVFNGFGKVPQSLLKKQMRFRLISIIELIGTIVNSFFSILFALISPSVWSLVWAYLIREVTMANLLRYYSGFRIKFEFDKTIAKQLLHFGKFVMGLSFLWYLADNFSHIVVAKMLGPTLLGFYALACNIGNFINTHFSYLISNVMFPAYAEIQDDLLLLKKAYLKNIKFVSIFSIPFSFALVALAQELVMTLYGPKWKAIIPYVRLFGLVQFVIPLMVCATAIFLGCGKPEYNFRLMLATVLIKIPLVLIFTKWWGVLGSVSAIVIVYFVMAPVNIALVHRIIKFQYGEFFMQCVPAAFCASLMTTVIWLLKFFILRTPVLMPYPVQLLMLSLAGVTTYFLAFSWIDRRGSLEIKQMIFVTQTR